MDTLDNVKIPEQPGILLPLYVERHSKTKDEQIAPKGFVYEILSIHVCGDVRLSIAQAYYLFVLLLDEDPGSYAPIEAIGSFDRLIKDWHNNVLAFYKNSISGGGIQDFGPLQWIFPKPIRRRKLYAVVQSDLGSSTNMYEWLWLVNCNLVPMNETEYAQLVAEKGKGLLNTLGELF